MKVLMTADTVGGVWSYALELARALRPSGTEIALATMGAPLSEAQRAEAAALPHVALHESAFRLLWMEDSWDDVARAGRWLLEVAEAERPDVVHLNGLAHGALAWRRPVLVVGHSCVCSWHEGVRGEPAPPEWERYRAEVTASLRAADLIAAPSRAMLAALERHYGPLGRARVAYNGRALGPLARSQKQPFVLAAGRVWDEAKGIDRLAAVAPRLAWPVRIAGDSRHPDGGVASFENVELLGRLAPAALHIEMGRASVFAAPARYEPFGLGALEAALAGCALVLGDIPSQREIWADAALFARGEADLAEALQALIERPALREDLARRARRRAARYTPAAMAAAYLGLYRGLAGARAAPRVSHGAWRRGASVTPYATRNT